MENDGHLLISSVFESINNTAILTRFLKNVFGCDSCHGTIKIDLFEVISSQCSGKEKETTKILKKNPKKQYTHTHTHTHTYIYIYIYKYMIWVREREFSYLYTFSNSYTQLILNNCPNIQKYTWIFQASVCVCVCVSVSVSVYLSPSSQ